MASNRRAVQPPGHCLQTRSLRCEPSSGTRLRVWSAALRRRDQGGGCLFGVVSRGSQFDWARPRRVAHDSRLSGIRLRERVAPSPHA